MNEQFILTVRCKDGVGIVAAVASALASAETFITEASDFGDEQTGLFFMRTVFRPTGSRLVSRDDFAATMVPVARRFEMGLGLHAAGERMEVLLALSKLVAA
jgi:formyltetrahydrofolate deformylase